jgi:hypothetical protein
MLQVRQKDPTETTDDGTGARRSPRRALTDVDLIDFVVTLVALGDFEVLNRSIRMTTISSLHFYLCSL